MEHHGEGTQKPTIAIPEISSQPGIRRSATASSSASDSDEQPISVESPVRRQDQWRLLRRKVAAFLNATPAARKSLIVAGPPVLLYITLRTFTLFLSLVMGTQSEGPDVTSLKADVSHDSAGHSVQNLTSHLRPSPATRFAYAVGVPRADPGLLNEAAWKELLVNQGGRRAALGTGGPTARTSEHQSGTAFGGCEMQLHGFQQHGFQQHGFQLHGFQLHGFQLHGFPACGSPATQCVVLTAYCEAYPGCSCNDECGW